MPVSRSLPTGNAGQFTATHWSVVLAAAGTPSPLAQDALEKLCRTYWRPLYTYICRQGLSVTDAEDLTQEFFSRFLQKHFLADVHPLKGRFRCFLLAALKHFLANEWDRARAEKRGGNVAFVSLDEETEGRGLVESLGGSNPEEAYDREWALAVLDRAMVNLKQEYAAAGKGEWFERLKCFLAGGADPGTYGAVALEMGIAPGTIAVAVHRMRKRYGELLRAVVAGTVDQPAEIEEEMRHLFSVINR
ncbi:MAG TPA: sigma-70 family RNA polymerase sigma factor [Verrucomicrobiae bacterium]